MSKRIFVIMVSAFAMLTILAACQDESKEEESADATAEETAEVFLNHLAEEAYDDAYELLDETMENEIDPSDLEELWTALNQQLGDHIEFEYQHIEEGTDDAFDIVIIDSHHEKEDVTFRVTINEDQEVAGFFLE